MKKRYKIVFNVEIADPDMPFPAGGDYTHLNRIQGVAKWIGSRMRWPHLDATVTLDKIIDKGEVVPHGESKDE